MYTCNDDESQEEVVKAEGKEAWRALMKRVWDAVVEDPPSGLKHLEVRQMTWKAASTYNSKAFHACFGHLETFSLSIHGEENGAGWNVDMLEGYPILMAKLDVIFFDHLRNVRILVLKAPAEGPLGLEGEPHAPLALREGQMP